MSRIQRLAYVVASATDLDAWKTYAESMLGMAASVRDDGALALKMDERAFRFLIEPGKEDRYTASGWEVDSAEDFEASVQAVRDAGVKIEILEDDAARSRSVQKLAQFQDPAGNQHELCFGAGGDAAAFKSPIPHSGFLTGELGCGHTVLPAIPFEDTLKFFTDVLGFGMSDVFNFQPAPDAPTMRIYFLHAACGRHHSLALAEMPHPAGCVHVMVEVNSMTEVGLAHDRAQQQGVKFMATLGEHENDHMTSFYIQTPGGFALEYGYGGLVLDPDSWKTTETQRVSVWGHDFSVGFN